MPLKVAMPSFVLPRTIPCLVLTTASICVYLSIPDQRTRDRNRVGGNMSNQVLYRKYTTLDKLEYIVFRLDKGEFWLYDIFRLNNCPVASCGVMSLRRNSRGCLYENV